MKNHDVIYLVSRVRYCRIHDLQTCEMCLSRIGLVRNLLLPIYLWLLKYLLRWLLIGLIFWRSLRNLFGYWRTMRSSYIGFLSFPPFRVSHSVLCARSCVSLLSDHCALDVLLIDHDAPVSCSRCNVNSLLTILMQMITCYPKDYRGCVVQSDKSSFAFDLVAITSSGLCMICSKEINCFSHSDCLDDSEYQFWCKQILLLTQIRLVYLSYTSSVFPVVGSSKFSLSQDRWNAIMILICMNFRAMRYTTRRAIHGDNMWSWVSCSD